MAPSGRIRSSTRPTRRQPRRNPFKKRLPHSKTNQEAIISRNLPSSNSSTTTISDDVEIPSTGCCTPKAQRFRIPEISTCPPAPKKQRLVSNCSLQRSPIAFFAPPDLELFFFFALRDISVWHIYMRVFIEYYHEDHFTSLIKRVVFKLRSCFSLVCVFPSSWEFGILIEWSLETVPLCYCFQTVGHTNH